MAFFILIFLILPVPFSDPVNMKVQFMDGAQNDFNDIVCFAVLIEIYTLMMIRFL